MVENRRVAGAIARVGNTTGNKNTTGNLCQKMGRTQEKGVYTHGFTPQKGGIGGWVAGKIFLAH